MPHPDILVELTYILVAIDNEDFEWDQEWINQYWDEIVRIQNAEVKDQRAGVHTGENYLIW